MVLKRLIILPLLALPFLGFAQGDLSLDVNGGVNYSYGDINSLWAPVGNLGLKYSLSNQFGLKANFGAGMLKGGDDEYNREFENQYFQYSVRGVFNISQITSLHRTLPKINLLAHGGIGQIHNDAEDTRSDYPEGQEPRPDNSGTALVFPFGGTIKFYLSNRLDLNLNANYTYASSDKIDNFDPSIAANRFNDGYASYMAGLTYKFGSGSGDESHSDWEQNNFNEEMSDLEQKYNQRIKVLKSKIDELQTLISSNSMASWENEAKLNRLEEQINAGVPASGEEPATTKGEQDKSGDMQDKGDGSETQTGEGDNKTIQKTEKTVVNKGGLSNKRFVSVIGSYKSKKNAKEFAQKIEQNQGYSPGVLYNYYKGWYYVHVNNHEEIDKARQALKQTREDLGIEEAWIYFRSADDLEKYRK